MEKNREEGYYWVKKMGTPDEVPTIQEIKNQMREDAMSSQPQATITSITVTPTNTGEKNEPLCDTCKGTGVNVKIVQAQGCYDSW